MLESPFIHVDDTKVNIQGEDNYVWVFTDGVHVVFRMTATRESDIVHEVLKGYKGVMVSDFYPGFDSVGCRQQKCLIHLVRDINDELWDNPFDSQLEGFAAAVRDLLVPILQDVQRYGLKARHLHKHKVRVDRFYRDEIETGRCSSEVTMRFKDAIPTLQREHVPLPGRGLDPLEQQHRGEGPQALGRSAEDFGLLLQELRLTLLGPPWHSPDMQIPGEVIPEVPSFR